MKTLSILMLSIVLVFGQDLATLSWNYPVPPNTNAIVRIYTSTDVTQPMSQWSLYQEITNPWTNYTIVKVIGTRYYYGNYTITGHTNVIANAVTIQWSDVNTDVDSFKIYVGTSSGSYDTIWQVYNSMLATIDLVDPTTYYITTTSVDVDGQESDFSYEFTYVSGDSVPTISTNLHLTIQLIR